MTRVLHDTTPLFVAGDPSAPRAVIVVQEAFGVNDHIRSVTERFAAEGYYAVAPEFFHRSGSPEVPYDDFPEAMRALGQLTKAGITSDLEHAAAFLSTHGYGPASIGIVGYCMGGSVTLYAATLGLVGAAATYYGGGVEVGRFGLESLLELGPTLRAPWIGFYGDLDKGIPVPQVEALRVAVASSGQDTALIRYADGDHGFHCDGRPAVYNADAAGDAYSRTLGFFHDHLRDK